jgi:hypothetical protein
MYLRKQMTKLDALAQNPSYSGDRGRKISVQASLNKRWKPYPKLKTKVKWWLTSLVPSSEFNLQNRQREKDYMTRWKIYF